MNGVPVPTLREYDFSDEKLQDSVGLQIPSGLALTLLPQLGLDFHKNKTFCAFNPLIFRTGIF
jgi:hypothetical protein